MAWEHIFGDRAKILGVLALHLLESILWAAIWVTVDLTHGTSGRRGSWKLNVNGRSQPHIWLHFWHTSPFSNLLPISSVSCSVQSLWTQVQVRDHLPSVRQAAKGSQKPQEQLVFCCTRITYFCACLAVFSRTCLFFTGHEWLSSKVRPSQSLALKYSGQQVFQE